MASHALVPLAGSPLADEALVHALDTFDRPVTVLNVVTPLDDGMSEGGILDAGESREDAARDRAETLIEQARRRAEEVDRDFDTVVETGDPAETILAYVDEHDVDHVVMGGHGGAKSDLASRLLGTVATVVVGEAPVTVTVDRRATRGRRPAGGRARTRRPRKSPA